MSAWMIASLLAAGVAVGWRPSSERRLAGLTLPVEHRSAPGSALPSARGGPPAATATRPWAAVLLDVSTVVLVVTLVPGLLGVVVALPAAFTCHRWLGRLPERDRLNEHAVARRQLPLVLELVAAGLRAGSTTATAVALAAEAAGPSVTWVMREVVAGLRLGASPDEAWRPALAVEGFDALARAAIRSEKSGAALATVCSELARRERSRRHLEAQAAVRRAGVWAVLPLALCFLPAFVLLGVVPVVVGLLQSVAFTGA